MEESRYSLEQIFDSYRKYKEICDLFFDLVTDEDIKSKLVDILYQGRYKSFVFYSGIVNRDNPRIEARRRISMAYLFLKNPDTFDFFVQNKINLFHGTNANALPSILKYGLNSVYESEKNGICVSTGEKITRMFGIRDFVSFTDVLDIANNYSMLSPESGHKNLSFEVIIGTTVDDVYETGRIYVPSSVVEVGVENKLPLENIKVIGVPSSKVNFVKKLVGDKGIEVFPIDGIRDRFFFIHNNGIEIYYDLYNDLKNNLRNPLKSKVFKLEDMKKIMVECLLSKISGKNHIMEGEIANDGKRVR